MMYSNYSLLPYNTFGIDVRATCFFEYGAEDELCDFLRDKKLPESYLHVGRGSNLLFTKDFDGLILHSHIQGIEILAEDDEHVRVRVGAGMLWDDFVDYCVKHGWYGAENLSLIPGEVGAAAVQNIGAYGVEVKDLIESVEGIDVCGEKRIYTNAECGYAYRDSIFKHQENVSVFVTYVHFVLSKKTCFSLDYGTVRKELEKYPSIDLQTVRHVIISIRQAKLPNPKELGNAGSFFKNPLVARCQLNALQALYPDMPYYDIDAEWVKIPAGWLIEQCGWKGKSLGHAAVHARQALVLVNLGGATGAEIVALAKAIRNSVYDKFQINIQPEVNIM